MNNAHHEEEVVELTSDVPIRRRDLHKWLRQRGYKSEDDFYYLDRKGKIENWQSRSLASIDLFFNKQEIYETEEDVEEGTATHWNSLRVSYLMATLPRECIEPFVDEIDTLAQAFRLRVTYQAEAIDAKSLLGRLTGIADTLEKDFGGAGSKALRVLILQEYAR